RVKSIAFDSSDETVKHYTNICIISRTLLLNLINETLSRGNSHFIKDVLIPHISTLRIYGHKHEGYYEEMSSLQKYYDESMRFLNREIRDEVFRTASVYTKVKDSMPTRYGENAVVKNALIADGCTIEGEVYNSIIFRGVKVAKGAVVKNCVLMQNTIINENASVNCIITDKNVIIRDRRNLSGCEVHPFFISKGSVI
ncbi:MAG: glucose-1-phosphate adenylyltransferase subunit GlgD, partial [Clostridia bacterium]|nr:glucose-1-phosphate adenylyltransferase subunit GlgD [Clostridia bacterium]